jgi:hypothetical protein
MFKFYKCHKEIGKLLEKDKEQQMSWSEERWQYVKQVIVSVVNYVIGHEQEQRRNDWFDNEKKKLLKQEVGLELKWWIGKQDKIWMIIKVEEEKQRWYVEWKKGLW